MQYLPILAGVCIILLIFHDAFEVMLLPRRVRRKLRLVALFFRFTWLFWSKTARLIRSGARRESFLSVYGPFSMLLLLGLWGTGLVIGFGLLQWATLVRHTSFWQAVYFSGITFFTVGYGDQVPSAAASKALSVIEAGTGLGFIAIVIGYLPVLYQLFSNRESQVIILDARAGSPPTAATLLRRHAQGESLDLLESLLREWEHWAAELLESHLSYPVLGYYRSQHDNQSWLAALAAIMDACALIMVGFRNVRTFQARMTFASGRLALIELGRVFQTRPDPNAIDRLPSNRFEELLRDFEESGLPFSNPDDAERSLRSFRATYEPFLMGLAEHFLIELPGWMPDKDSDLDNWQNSPRGRSAKQLVELVDPSPD